MSIAAALAELERSPALPDHVAYLQGLLEDEQRRREQFQKDFARHGGEFINGRVCTLPVVPGHEAEAVRRVWTLLDRFAGTGGGRAVRDGKNLVRCQRNDYAPDVCFYGPAKTEVFEPGQWLLPPPDLAVEVLSPTTVENDRKLKWQDYARHGVGEYWIVDAGDRMVEQYVLASGADTFQLKARLPHGARLTSVKLAGLVLPVAAFFDPEEFQRQMETVSGFPATNL